MLSIYPYALFQDLIQKLFIFDHLFQIKQVNFFVERLTKSFNKFIVFKTGNTTGYKEIHITFVRCLVLGIRTEKVAVLNIVFRKNLIADFDNYIFGKNAMLFVNRIYAFKFAEKKSVF